VQQSNDRRSRIAVSIPLPTNRQTLRLSAGVDAALVLHRTGVVVHPVPCCDGLLGYLRRMPKSQPTRLLTTRWRTGIALGLTAFVFALAVRDVLLVGHRRGLLLPLDFLLHGWPLVAANLVFYGYLCWLAFWFIRGTHGRERVFMVGWFSATLLPPLETLEHGFTMEIRYICAFGLAVSLLAALSLLLHPTGIGDSTPGTA
jgi:hypothetical protein